MVELISSRKTVPVWAASKRPVRLSIAPVNGPADVAEQLAFQQVLGQRPAVDAHERAAAAGAEPVDGLGDQLLARARLAQQQHRGVGPGHLPREPVDLLHGRTGADQPGNRRPGFARRRSEMASGRKDVAGWSRRCLPVTFGSRPPVLRLATASLAFCAVSIGWLGASMQSRISPGPAGVSASRLSLWL